MWRGGCGRLRRMEGMDCRRRWIPSSVGLEATSLSGRVSPTHAFRGHLGRLARAGRHSRAASFKTSATRTPTPTNGRAPSSSCLAATTSHAPINSSVPPRKGDPPGSIRARHLRPVTLGRTSVGSPLRELRLALSFRRGLGTVLLLSAPVLRMSGIQKLDLKKKKRPPAPHP